jgi:hypothetical protein
MRMRAIENAIKNPTLQGYATWYLTLHCDIRYCHTAQCRAWLLTLVLPQSLLNPTTQPQHLASPPSSCPTNHSRWQLCPPALTSILDTT